MTLVKDGIRRILTHKHLGRLSSRLLRGTRASGLVPEYVRRNMPAAATFSPHDPQYQFDRNLPWRDDSALNGAIILFVRDGFNRRIGPYIRIPPRRRPCESFDIHGQPPIISIPPARKPADRDDPE